MKKFCLMLCMLILAGCSPIGDVSLNPQLNPSDSPAFIHCDDMFVTSEGIYHHERMRELTNKIDDIETLVSKKTPVDRIYREVLGDLYDEWQNADVPNYRTDSCDFHADRLLKMIKKNATTDDLLTYMKKNHCQTAFNEVLVSSYIVFTQEDHQVDTPMDDIDWTGVATCDAMGLIGGVGGSAAISAGVIVGSIIRKLLG